MQEYEMYCKQGHIIVKFDGRDWLLDTGGPTSFGSTPALVVAGRKFDIPGHYMGLTAAKLSEYVGHTISGLVGADVLKNFDILIDSVTERVSFTDMQMELSGEILKLKFFMGIPVIEASIEGAARRMFFDTGAQISYFQSDTLTTFPAAGRVTDFYPGIGQFQTETYLVDVSLGNVRYALRCGILPGLLGNLLRMANTEGVIGNEILKNRRIGFFPRRGLLILVPCQS